MDVEKLIKTPLFSWHRDHHAQIVDFNGWAMPLKYSNIIEEHNTVRQGVGIFDVSHMGRFSVHGNNSLQFLQKILTNNIKQLSDNQICYTLICNPKGGIIDDILVYRQNNNNFLLIVNAGNTEKDFSWLKDNCGEENVTITNETTKTSMIAIQGPASSFVIQSCIKTDISQLKYFHFIETFIDETKIILSRTGYTGEDGFEIIMKKNDCLIVWEKIIEAGKSHHIKPIGLGARDTLRLEMKYALYGSDINEAITPTEADLSWVVALNKGDFIGRKALLEQQEKRLNRKLIGFEMVDKAIPRHGYPIYRDKKKIAEVASGTFSPTLQKGIGTAYLPIRYAHAGIPIQIEIRDQYKLAEVTKTPFYTCGSVHKYK